MKKKLRKRQWQNETKKDMRKRHTHKENKKKQQEKEGIDEIQERKFLSELKAKLTRLTRTGYSRGEGKPWTLRCIFRKMNSAV